MHTLQINVSDNLYEQFIQYISTFPSKEISFQEINPNETKESYQSWSEEEILVIGKVGFDSKSFKDDNEDYSKW